MAEELAKNHPTNTLLNFYWLATIRAAVELDHDAAAKAAEYLDSAAAYELGTSTPFQLGTLYPVYVRGEAYLALHQGKRILASPAPTSCRATPPKPRRPIRISSRYGRTPTPTFPFSSLRRLSTQSCSEQ